MNSNPADRHHYTAGTPRQNPWDLAVAIHAVAARTTDAPTTPRFAARVLLAEDNPVNQEVIDSRLRIFGAESEG